MVRMRVDMHSDCVLPRLNRLFSAGRADSLQNVSLSSVYIYCSCFPWDSVSCGGEPGLPTGLTYMLGGTWVAASRPNNSPAWNILINRMCLKELIQQRVVVDTTKLNLNRLIISDALTVRIIHYIVPYWTDLCCGWNAPSSRIFRESCTHGPTPSKDSELLALWAWSWGYHHGPEQFPSKIGALGTSSKPCRVDFHSHASWSLQGT